VEVLVSNIWVSSVGGASAFIENVFVVKFRKLRAVFAFYEAFMNMLAFMNMVIE